MNTHIRRKNALAFGIPVSTYGAHERAEERGGRDYGADEARQYARRFGVTTEWLLTGTNRVRGDQRVEHHPMSVKVVGYAQSAYLKNYIDEWRSKERHKPSRSEAIRWLVWKGLEAEEKEASMNDGQPDRGLLPLD
jgi:hypothetical protein